VRPAWFVRGDIDGFFGLFVDNLLQLLLIAVLCPALCGVPVSFVVGRILPGAALSILLGNFYYAWQARRLAERTGRSDVTALPYGINTPSLLAYVFFIMAPVYAETHDWRLAWQAGLFACLGSAVFETLGAFVGDWLRRHTPRAALLSALAGIALTYIAVGFLFRIFASPAIALLPALLILVLYAARLKLPGAIPGGLFALILGAALAWTMKALGLHDFQPSAETYRLALHLPWPALADMLAFLRDGGGLRFAAVILPMGLFNVIGSLQNLESAEAAGDRFETRPSLLANGLGSFIAAGFGSPFPTTIYIGHPGWKAMGARWGYSILDGVAIAALCLLGGTTLFLKLVPIEAALGILIWIGIIITAQAFQEVPKSHALGVAVGLLPALAAWAVTLVETTLGKAGTTLYATAPRFGEDLFIHGAIALSQGFLLTSMLLSAIVVFAIDRQLLRAAAWSAAAATLSFVGVIHAYRLTPSGIHADFGLGTGAPFALSYLALAAILVALHRRGQV